MGVAFVLLVAFTFLPVGIMIYIVKENVNKERQLQAVSGVGSVLYWLATFFWDAVSKNNQNLEVFVTKNDDIRVLLFFYQTQFLIGGNDIKIK